MARPTRLELAGALTEMHGIAQELFGCYANDVQPNRAEAMEALRNKADLLAEILHRMPFDEIEAGRRAFAKTRPSR